MKIEVVIHDAEEGGYWAEVPTIQGCATQTEIFEELLSNIEEAVEGCLDSSASISENRKSILKPNLVEELLPRG